MPLSMEEPAIKLKYDTEKTMSMKYLRMTGLE
jgi:hypothetical protein